MATGRKGAKPVGQSTAPAAPRGDDLLQSVRGLAELVTEHGLSELIVQRADTTITLRRGGQVMQQVAMAMPAQASHGTLVHHAPTGPAAHAAATAPPIDDGSHVVTSPFVGTFYRRPNPDTAEYVKLNGRVEKGAVLCIVEAMKLMNEIEADISGTVVGVLAEDGSVVEFGQPLFKIRPG